MTCELIDGSIFLHIPKTGGTWVSKVLAEMGLIRRPVGRHKHTAFERALVFPNGKRRWKEWTRAENWKLDNWLSSGRQMRMPYTFCFVRHPVRWYESWWRFLMGKEAIPWLASAVNESRQLKRWTPFSVPCAALCEDFNSFVRNVHKHFPGYVTWLYGNYAVPEINFVGRQEHLRMDLLRVLKVRGLCIDETRVFKQPAANEARFAQQAINWDPALLRDVQAAEMPSIIRFNYQLLELGDLLEGISRAQSNVDLLTP